MTSSIARPNYADLAPYISVDTTTSPVAVLLGNAALNASKAWNLDASVEYYLNKGVISVGAFYRHIDDPIYPVSTNVTNGISVVSSTRLRRWSTASSST